MTSYPVLLFAGLRDKVGAPVIELTWAAPEVPTVADLRASALESYPCLDGEPFAVAVDAVYASDDFAVPQGAEVAFLPPVSGG